MVWMLFNLMIPKALIYTRDTASRLMENISSNKEYITKVNLNTETFKQHVKVNVEGFKARGRRADDLTTNPFKAYHIASDTELFSHIK